jgi:hypothetical protein
MALETRPQAGITFGGGPTLIAYLSHLLPSHAGEKISGTFYISSDERNAFFYYLKTTVRLDLHFKIDSLIAFMAYIIQAC